MSASFTYEHTLLFILLNLERKLEVNKESNWDGKKEYILNQETKVQLTKDTLIKSPLYKWNMHVERTKS